MKRLRYIVTILLSSLIVISGVGVSIAQYCCAGCEAEQSCCATACSACGRSHDSSHKGCKDTGCSVVHYKVDLVQHASEASPLIPCFTWLCDLPLLVRFDVPLMELPVEPLLHAPPLPPDGRHYLALYSTLLI